MKPPFQKGDQVYCYFPKLREYSEVARTVTSVQILDGHFFVSADGGPKCPHCNTVAAKPTGLIIAMWFSKVDPE